MNSSTTSANCACYTPYIWNTTTCVSCLQISNSRGINDATSCVCKTGYVWKSATFTCDVNCAIIPNTNGTVNGTFCSCNNTRFSFNPFTATCEIQCDFNGPRVSPAQCYCDDAYSWNAESLDCEVDCSTIANVDPTSPTINAYTCNCNTNSPNNYFWNPVALICEVDCSEVIGSIDGIVPNYPCTCATP